MSCSGHKRSFEDGPQDSKETASEIKVEFDMALVLLRCLPAASIPLSLICYLTFVDAVYSLKPYTCLCRSLSHSRVALIGHDYLLAGEIDEIGRRSTGS